MQIVVCNVSLEPWGGVGAYTTNMVAADQDGFGPSWLARQLQ